MSDDNKDPAGKWTTGAIRGILLRQIADLRERETTIRNHYGGNPPADDPELQHVMAEMESWRETVADIEREIFGHSPNDEGTTDE